MLHPRDVTGLVVLWWRYQTKRIEDSIPTKVDLTGRGREDTLESDVKFLLSNLYLKSF
jgi:hypothetical protein